MSQGESMSALTSRFITVDDPNTDEFVYRLPASWWSRRYEYEWVKNFVDEGDCVLDAASGMFHPVQFFMADKCREVYACDNDSRILSDAAIAQMAREDIGEAADALVCSASFAKVNRACCSITQLPYEDKFFDKIYCISVLEHLRDWFNKKEGRAKYFGLLKDVLIKDIYDCLKEFKRTLKDDGLIILTFDFPKINLGYLDKTIDELGLEFAGEVNFNLPGNAIWSPELELHCFRAVLKKRHSFANVN
jgi:SAM-dependent methyltransferase